MVVVVVVRLAVLAEAAAVVLFLLVGVGLLAQLGELEVLVCLGLQALSMSCTGVDPL